MSKGVICRQDGCKNYAATKYTWPGRDQSAVCAEHLPKLLGVANAIGLYVQVLPISVEEHERSRLDSDTQSNSTEEST